MALGRAAHGPQGRPHLSLVAKSNAMPADSRFPIVQHAMAFRYWKFAHSEECPNFSLL
jgi:hypothetical protein